MKRKLQTGHGNETLQMIPPDIFICDHVACTSIPVPSKCLCLYESRYSGVLVQADADYDGSVVFFYDLWCT